MHTFLYSHWLSLPIGTRHSIAFIVGVHKTSSVHVVNDKVVADGYAIEDVESALSVESLQRKLNTEESDPKVLWDLLILKAVGPTGVVEIVAEAPIVSEPETPKPDQTLEESNAKPEKIKVIKEKVEKVKKAVKKVATKVTKRKK